MMLIPNIRGGFSRKDLFKYWRADLLATCGEFIGTVLFMLFGFGVVQTVQFNLAMDGTSTATATNSTERLVAYFYMSSGFAFSLFATASIFYRFTGSIFNPSVTLALFLVGAVRPLRFLLVSAAQMLGSIVAAGILYGITPGPLDVGVSLADGINRTQGLFIEMFCTALLVLSVLMLSAEKHVLTPFAPLLFGYTLFAILLSSVVFTGGSCNTARAFGPAVISGFPAYHWVYWLGPTLGSLMAVGFYILLKSINYWEINPAANSTNMDESPVMQAMHRAKRDVQGGQEELQDDRGAEMTV